jgi:hypothetical protein
MSALEQLDRTISLCRDYCSATVSDAQICQSFQSVCVLCVADKLNLSSLSGQTCLTTTVALLSRMGMQVTLAIPETSMIQHQLPFVGPLLRSSLLASSNSLIAGATVRQDDSRHKPDLIFVLGDSVIENRSYPTWCLSGQEWCGRITQETTHSSPWTSEWPIGAMVSAALAAGEAFKYVMRCLPLRNHEDYIFFEPSPACNWDFGTIGIREGELDMGEVDIVSAGAITQATLYALLRIPALRMRGRVFDDDVTAATNLNRNMLSVMSDVGSEKAMLVASRCSSKFKFTPKHQRFWIEESGVQELAPCVLVGVDDIPSRWQVQRCASGVLIVSGTSHFSISSSCHIPGAPCCGCQHPVDDLGGPMAIPTVSFVSFWAGLAMAVRFIRYAVGAPYLIDRQHLWLTPLRMDQPHAALWSPVVSIPNCPVGCISSRRISMGGHFAAEAEEAMLSARDPQKECPANSKINSCPQRGAPRFQPVSRNLRLGLLAFRISRSAECLSGARKFWQGSACHPCRKTCI